MWMWCENETRSRTAVLKGATPSTLLDERAEQLCWNEQWSDDHHLKRWSCMLLLLDNIANLKFESKMWQKKMNILTTVCALPLCVMWYSFGLSDPLSTPDILSLHTKIQAKMAAPASGCRRRTPNGNADARTRHEPDKHNHFLALRNSLVRLCNFPAACMQQMDQQTYFPCSRQGSILLTLKRRWQWLLQRSPTSSRPTTSKSNKEFGQGITAIMLTYVQALLYSTTGYTPSLCCYPESQLA